MKAFLYFIIRNYFIFKINISNLKIKNEKLNNLKIKQDEKKNFPGPSDYEKSTEWTRQSPCTLKFRKNYYYEDDTKRMHDVSPMKYLPERKVTENARYKTYGIGIGLGKRSNEQFNNMKITPGPGDYHLPSLFEKRIQGKAPMN